MTAKTIDSVSTTLIDRWEQIGTKLAELAQEFPEEKFETAPLADVRTFGGVLRHVAFWNQYVAAVARGEKADDSANELPDETYSTKAKVIAALKSSTAAAAEAMRQHYADLDPAKATLAVSFIEHGCEHYGQLVMYARWAGVVPPASRT